MNLQYPFITLPEISDIEDEEVRYWIYRIDVIRDTVILLYKKLFTYSNHAKVTIVFLAAILKRQLEIIDSILILISKGRARDAGTLILNLYELTLDIQFVSLNPSIVETWLNHVHENKKPWRVQDQIKKIFMSSTELDAEKNFYKRLSMIKHGNNAGKHISFDIYFLDEKLVVSESTIASFMPNLYSIGYLLKRTFDAAIEMLNTLNINENTLHAEMIRVYDKFHSDFITIMEYNIVKSRDPNNTNLQEKLVSKLDLYKT